MNEDSSASARADHHSASVPPTRPEGPRAAQARAARYWRTNLTVMAVLLVLWAAAGLGAGVLFADSLNALSLGGFPLGFWFAQQGSIIAFVLIVVFYATWMNRLDRAHEREPSPHR